MDDLVLCEGFHFKQKLGSVRHHYPFCPKAQYCGFHIYFCGFFLSFYNWYFAIFWRGGKNNFFSSPFAAAFKCWGNYGMVKTVVTQRHVWDTVRKTEVAFELGAQHQSVPIQVSWRDGYKSFCGHRLREYSVWKFSSLFLGHKSFLSHEKLFCRFPPRNVHLCAIPPGLRPNRWS